MSERPRLDSWKEIARHLRRDVSTVIRWERERGLPVYRVPGGKLARVFAYPEELDRWLAARGAAQTVAESRVKDERPPVAPPIPGTRVALAAVAAALVAVTVAWAVATNFAAAPRRLAVSGNELVAMDESGRARWRYRFQPADAKHPAALWTHVGDVDDDGADDIFAAVEVGAPPSNQFSGALLRFAPDGEVRWSRAVQDRVAFREGEYGPPWAPNDLVVYRTNGEARIAWALHHFTWWPGMLVTLDGRGERIGTFVNAGWIRTAQPSFDGRSLFVSGVNTPRQAYVVAVLDADRPAGHSPEPPGNPAECLRCPAGDPHAYLVFPRTDVGRDEPFPGDSPSVTTFADGTVEVHVLESSGAGMGATIYKLAADLGFVDVRFSEAFVDRHRQLEREGRLDHSFENCPERRGLEVQRWTPARGWQPVQVPAR